MCFVFYYSAVVVPLWASVLDCVAPQPQHLNAVQLRHNPVRHRASVLHYIYFFYILYTYTSTLNITLHIHTVYLL